VYQNQEECLHWQGLVAEASLSEITPTGLSSIEREELSEHDIFSRKKKVDL